MKRLALVLPLMLLLAACGGGDDDAVKASGPTRGDYVKQAEAVCKSANDNIDALPGPTTPAALQSLVEQTLKIATKATNDIKAIEPPEADKAELQKRVIDPLEGQLLEGRAYLAKVKAAVAAKDNAELGRLIQNPPTGHKADIAWMRSYGFDECADAASTDG